MKDESAAQQAQDSRLSALDLAIEDARFSRVGGSAKMDHADAALQIAVEIKAYGSAQGVDARLVALLEDMVESARISPANGYAKMSYAAMALRIADGVASSEKVPPKMEKSLTALFKDVSESARTTASSGDAISYEAMATRITARLDLAKLDRTLDYVWLSSAEGGVKIPYAREALDLANKIKASQGPSQAVDARLTTLLEDMEKSAKIAPDTSSGLMNYAAVALQIKTSLGTTQRKIQPLQPGR